MSKTTFLILALIATVAHADVLGSLGGVNGRYSSWLDGLLSSGSYEKFYRDPSGTAAPLELTCLETPGRKYYIGVVQNMRVKAPIAKLQSVVEDINSYVKLFPGYDAIRVESRSGNRVLTYWENHIPVFFVPNVRYRMIYRLDNARPDLKIYRYQLEKKGSLLESDGFIVLKKISETETRYLETDFFEPDLGVFESLASGKIWPESVDGLYESDLAFLLKAEHADWTDRRCHDEAVRTVDRMKEKPSARCYAARSLQWQQVFPGLPIPNHQK